MGRAAEPQELDVHALLRLFLSKVENGRPATFATFREAWQELRFSFIYEVSGQQIEDMSVVYCQGDFTRFARPPGWAL